MRVNGADIRKEEPAVSSIATGRSSIRGDQRVENSIAVAVLPPDRYVA